MRVWGPHAQECAYALYVAARAKQFVLEYLGKGPIDADNLFALIGDIKDLEGVIIGAQEFRERADNLLECYDDPEPFPFVEVEDEEDALDEKAS